MPLQFHQFPFLSDSYGVLVHDPATGQTASIDAGEAAAVRTALERTGWSLSHIWITHHHWDHVDGLADLKAATGCKVLGPSTVEGVDLVLGDGARFEFAGHEVSVLHTPGHTTDMLNYYIPDAGVVFAGDTLFAMGCGRLFEGDGPMMWGSLQKLAALPPETQVYAGHEYTTANAAFALTVDPGNAALAARQDEVKALRVDGKATLPTTIAQELATNPFMRAGDAGIREHLGMVGASDAEVFTEIRRRKDTA